ncbi:hypothetical protein SDC9_94716 [bioreactor metagenome]|uniref:Uncharacterized protein n=1 Tax=bioreactor metagenome TaxID=1076179 RepID=A0A645A480_9ZZZZ
MDAVSAAERADCTGFRERVLLRLLAALADRTFAGGGRQQRAVLPIGMGCEIGIRIKPRTVDSLEHILAVCWCGRPVHKLMRTVGTLVKLVDTPFVGEVSSNGDILVGSDVAGRGNNNSNTRCLQCMTVGSV